MKGFELQRILSYLVMLHLGSLCSLSSKVSDGSCLPIRARGSIDGFQVPNWSNDWEVQWLPLYYHVQSMYRKAK